MIIVNFELIYEDYKEVHVYLSIYVDLSVRLKIRLLHSLQRIKISAKECARYDAKLLLVDRIKFCNPRGFGVLFNFY